MYEQWYGGAQVGKEEVEKHSMAMLSDIITLLGYQLCMSSGMVVPR